ncbi:ubiquitin-related domain-containing protein [Tanacetum coccineum]|uniref:Ubiquitin-related domain-containing protein n=1 Tax=Tanacetum coccineum TaxID=301880 RepID=A0ABQ4XML9_9ASTR
MDPNALAVKQEPLDTPKGSYINLKVVSQLNELDPFFRVKRDDPLQQLFIKWSHRANVDYRTIRFLYDGKRVDGNRTPDQMGLEDGDCIDAMTEQTGGHSMI